MMNRAFLRMTLAGAVAVAALGGCRDTNRASSFGPDGGIGLKLEPTSREIFSGEVVTVAARTENLLGRDASVKWLAPGGDISTEQNGRIARVRYDQAGTYTVTAQLFVDDREVRRDQVTVRVNPIR